MKNLRFWATGALALAFVVLPFALSAQTISSGVAAQIVDDTPLEPQLMPPEEVPLFGTFYMISDFQDDSGAPPYPYNPFFGAAVYSTRADGTFIVDDSEARPERFRSVQNVDLVTLDIWTHVEELVDSVNAIKAQRLARSDAALGGTTLSSASGSRMLMSTATLSLDPGVPGDGSGTNTIPQITYAATVYGSNELWLEITGVTNGVVTLNIHGTVSGVQYEILSKGALESAGGWSSEGAAFIGADGVTAATVSMGTRTSQLFFWARSWQDSNGTGLPDWWQMQWFGSLGADPYGDADGDGWNNLQEYQNGTAPNGFNTPAAPSGLVATYDSATGDVTVKWNPSAGPVMGYTLEKYVYVYTQSPSVTDFSLAASATSKSDIVPNVPYRPTTYGPTTKVSYKLKVRYSGGDSSWTREVFLADESGRSNPNIFLIPGSNSVPYLAAFALPGDTVAVRLTRIDYSAHYNHQDSAFDASWDIPVSSFTNGLFPLTPAMTFASVDSYGYAHYDWWVEIVGGTNWPSAAWKVVSYGESTYSNPTTCVVAPFFDGRIHLKQNITVLLRVPDFSASALLNDEDTYPFYMTVHYVNNGDDYTSDLPGGSNYVYAGFYDMGDHDRHTPPSMWANELVPFRDNYLYRNLGASPLNVNTCGEMTNGVVGSGSYFWLYYPKYFFDVESFSGTAIPAILWPAEMRWMYFDFYKYDPEGVFNIGMTCQTNNDSATFSMSGGAPNLYGVPYVSARISYNDTAGLHIVTLDHGESVTVPLVYDNSGISANVNSIYPEAAQPQLETVDHYFVTMPKGYDSQWSTILWPVPGQPEFSVTNTSPVLIAGFADPQYRVAGWAKQRIVNGYADKFAYLGQYFDGAYTIGTNGLATTNVAGIVSPYGDFFPTIPGPVALMTMRDIDPPYQRGTGTVNVIKLQLDANHDGTMDLSFGGPDNTSLAKPFTFWVNNDCDSNGKDNEVPPNAPDSSSTQIRSQRDLEDFARLWVCGMPALSYFSNNYTVNLSWRSVVSGNPSIKLFRAAESDGGIGYLTNTNIANNQLTSSVYNTELGIVTNGNTFWFPLAEFENAGDRHYLFEGAGVGNGELVLIIRQNGVDIAQTSTWLDLRDVKDFYERAVITNNMSGAKSNWTSAVQTVQPATSSAMGGDTDLILLIHGINVGYSDWLTQGDTVFKRLFWTGYHGKFAEVKWPCETFSFSTLLGADTSVFNRSEMIAYKAGTAMKTYVDQLHTRFPDHRLHLFAHSQGNAIIGAAIEQGATFDTYILTQGAIPASAYDVNAPIDAGLLGQETLNSQTPEWQPMGYRGVFTNMTGRIVNFFNTNDPVLNIWMFDQGAGKPDGYLLHLAWLQSGFPLPKPWYSFGGINGWYNTVLGSGSYMVTDPEESRAFVSRSRTLPIGQSPPESGHGVIQSGVDLYVRFGFNKAFPDDHSAQWAWPIQTTRPYFQEVLRSCQIEPAP